jgi:cysteine synthase
MAKCEHLNPSGSIKDRAALWIIENAERENRIKPGDTIVEGTSGNTGIALAMIAAAKGYKCSICLPSYVSQEKIDSVETFGAKVTKCPIVGFNHKDHYYHTSMRLAKEINGLHAD